MSQEIDATKILKKVVVDVFLSILLGVAVFASNNLWVPFQRGFFCDDESLMYPYSDDTVTVPMLRLVGIGLPVLAFLICEWYVLRKEKAVLRCMNVPIPTWVRGFYCVVASFTVGCLFVELAINTSKAVIGRPRPHFLTICQPSINCSLPEWRNRYVLPTDYTCTGPRTDKFADMHKSFLSGHSAFASFTMLYLAIYLVYRMQRGGSHSLRNTLAFGAAMLSWFCALSRISDFKHHWSDVLAGYILGILFAIVVWQWGTEIVQKEKKPSSPLQDPTAITPRITTVNGIN